LFVRPSSAEGGSWIVSERTALGARLPIDGVTDFAVLGEALHAILAYDDPQRSSAIRLADAQAILDRWKVTGFGAKDALTASDRLHDVLSARWPTALVRREVPVTARIGQQLVQGRIDLLVDADTTMAIIDHKSFPGRFEYWEAEALQYAPQVALYGQAVKSVSNRSCDELFIHMPVVGALLRIEKS
jgi:ATP-dependent exoDNAse (exonuclease V) beta subunit